MKKAGYVFSININSENKIDNAILDSEQGIISNSRKRKTNNQISILSIENINKQKHCPRVNNKINYNLQQGDFKEDITSKNINLSNLYVGDQIIIRNKIIIEVTKIGRDCYKFCPEFCETGKCSIMKFFIFGKVISGGRINVFDEIKIRKYRFNII